MYYAVEAALEGVRAERSDLDAMAIGRAPAGGDDGWEVTDLGHQLEARLAGLQEEETQT